MTDRSMDAVEVYVSKGPMVVIKQDSAMKQETSAPPADVLGSVGEGHFRARLERRCLRPADRPLDPLRQLGSGGVTTHVLHASSG